MTFTAPFSEIGWKQSFAKHARQHRYLTPEMPYDLSYNCTIHLHFAILNAGSNDKETYIWRRFLNDPALVSSWPQLQKTGNEGPIPLAQ